MITLELKLNKVNDNVDSNADDAADGNQKLEAREWTKIPAARFVV